MKWGLAAVWVVGILVWVGGWGATRVEAQAGGVVVDHTSLPLFDQIPDQYITAARNLRMIFFNKSVGSNINDGLTCLAYDSYAAAPIGCKRADPVTGQVPVFNANPKYNRANWVYEWWPTTGCGAWYDLVNCFNSRLNAVGGQYDVLSYDTSYLEVDTGSTIANSPGGFFSNNTAFNDVFDYMGLESQNPSKKFLYWTSSLSRGIGTLEATNFNQQMRNFARNNGKYLLDLADIEAYSPSGVACVDNRDGVNYCEPGSTTRCENFPNDGANYPAICPNYTTEFNGGHLNSVAKIRTAQAMWVLMAQVAGWRPGQTGGPSPTPIPTATRTPTPTPTGVSTPTPSRTPTNTPSPTPVEVLGDADGNGLVDGRDYVVWLSNYGRTTVSGPSAGDFNRSGVVDGADYVIWLNSYVAGI